MNGNIEAWTRDIKSLLIVEKHWTLRQCAERAIASTTGNG